MQIIMATSNMDKVKEIRQILDPQLYTGRCRTQVEVFLKKIRPLLPEDGDSLEAVEL